MLIDWTRIIYSRISITFLVAVIALILPAAWFGEHIVLIGFILILLGIPHGAGDYWIFTYLTKKLPTRKTQLHFILYYLVIILAYGLVWWLVPFVAFLIFIGISIFHFGQSNWHYLAQKNSAWSIVTYCLWGTGILGVPILIYHQEASLIIQEITGYYLNLDGIWRTAIIGILIGMNIIHIVLLRLVKAIDNQLFFKELLGFTTLMALFFNTPLLIGFGFYFVFWHSLDALYDQFRILKLDKKYDIKSFLVQLTVLTLSSFAGLVILYIFLGSNMNYGLNLGALFLFISMITVPHSILMDRLYHSAINNKQYIKIESF
jgi:Brp/Blh family beta-carotene 15,15'-monooxygenase